MKKVNQLKSMTWKQSSIFAVLSLACLLAGCGGGYRDETPKPPAPAPVPVSVAVSISPSSATLNQADTQQFAAAVTGSANTAVNWSVQEPAGGSVTNAGLYSSPNTAGTFHVVATSQSDPNKSGVATVNVPAISVSITPSLIGVLPNQQRQFSANVAGTANRDVQWSVDEGTAGGSINNQGLYTAPGALGTFHVTATSVADSTQSTKATVVVAAKGFLPAGSMNFARASHAETLLLDGRVLITGGQGDQGSDFWTDLDTAEIYDPKTGTFSNTGRMTQRRLAHTATLLPTGEVLIAGGWNFDANLATAEIYDPATGAFTATGNMGTTRFEHTATALLDGRVLLAGGGYTATAEVYDRVTGTFTAVGQMSTARMFHAATRLPDGRVLITGGDSGNISACQSFSSTEIFDPAKAGFVLGPAMAAPRSVHTATLLPSGSVLLAGGYPDGGDPEWCSRSIHSHAELFNPASGTAAAPIAMTVPRAGHAATLLLNGQVLLVDDSAELFDPVTAVFALTGSPHTSGYRRTATRLLDGRVLITGGGTSSAELYYPN